MANNIANPFFVSDGLGSINCQIQNPTTSYTVTSTDNAVICGADSIAITLTSTSNSPVYITSVDGTTQRSSCTIIVGSQDWTLTNASCSAWCVRMGAASANLWAVIGAATAS